MVTGRPDREERESGHVVHSVLSRICVSMHMSAYAYHTPAYTRTMATQGCHQREMGDKLQSSCAYLLFSFLFLFFYKYAIVKLCVHLRCMKVHFLYLLYSLLFVL